MKATYDLQPEIFSANGNGSYTYRWGIQEVTMERTIGEVTTTETKWQCNEVIVWGTVTREKIVATVIESIWGIDMEAKLLNDYNAAQMDILPAEYIQRYKDFLNARKVTKDQINADCIEIGI
ncbi:MAG: hypothetical protein NTZ69_16085 [Bacteroidia bacterium]|nr:hypothetical protein [Bacteroidia bacterium]